MRSVLTVGLVLSLAFVFVGCAQPPEEEINAAQAALDGAKKAEADIYAPEAYAAAKQALDDSRSKVEQEDYEGAKASALRAKEQADQAKSLADAAKPKVRDEAQALIARLTPVLSDAKSASGNAPQGKGADEDLDQLRSDLGQAEASLGSARTTCRFREVPKGSSSRAVSKGLPALGRSAHVAYADAPGRARPVRRGGTTVGASPRSRPTNQI